MVTLAEKYRGLREFGKNRRIAHSSWPVASYNEQHATITTTTLTTKARRHEDFSTNERGNYSDNLFVERRADADWSKTPTGTTPLVNNLYQGMSYDAVTGLYYERARWYSPSLGTWISQDPLHYINGENTYQFVGSSPVGNIDPQGLDPWGPLPPPGYTPPTINSVPQLLYGLMNMGLGIGQIDLGFSAQAGDLTPAAPLTAISGTVTIVNGALQFNKGGIEFMNSIGANLSNPFPTNVTGSTVTVVAGKLGLSKSTANLLGTATNLVPIGEENSDGFANAVSAFQRTGDWLDFARASLAWIQGHLFLAGPHCKNTLIDGPDKPKSWFESQGDKLA